MINNTVVPYSQAVTNLKKGGLSGNTLNMAMTSLGNSYKQPEPVSSATAPLPKTVAPLKVKGLVAPTPPSYSGLVGNIASVSAPSKTQSGILKNLTQIGDSNTDLVKNAQNIADSYGQQIAQTGQQGARFQAGQLTTGTSPIAEGNAAITAQSTSAQQQALATGENAALQGIDRQLTANSQRETAYNAALGGANTQQAQNLSGLGTAAGYAQPATGAIGTVTYDPLNQGQGGILGANYPGGVQAAGQLLGSFQGAQATGAAPGQTTAENYKSLGTAQVAGQAQGIQAQAAAPGLGSAAGQQAIAAAPGLTQAGIYGDQQTQVAQYTSALQQGQNLQSQLTDLIGTFGLNPNDLNAVNTGIQKIASNTSSPQYKILQNYINDVANTYAQILTPPGGSATDTTRGIAASMLDQTASGKSILAVMQSLDSAAKAKIAGIPTSQASSPAQSTHGTTVQTKAGAVNTNW